MRRPADQDGRGKADEEPSASYVQSRLWLNTRHQPQHGPFGRGYDRASYCQYYLRESIGRLL